jgi:hypothetical protein
MDKYLKPKQHYIDLYDRQTVERLRWSERFLDETKLPPIDGKEMGKEEAAHSRAYVKKLSLYFKTGERYANKDKTIREWMEADQKRDEFYESAQAPEGIRCLTCRNLLKSTYKQFWSELEKPDRVLFMYDCPNKCLPRRAFFSDGQEWRVKPNLCPRCNTELTESADDKGDKLVTTGICPKCAYTTTDELIWTHKKDELPDKHFARDRNRFCLTEEEGKKYQQGKWQIEQMAKFMEEWKKEEERRAEKLKENPKGFHLEGVGYRCFICGDSTPEGDNWYDEYGIKCLVCQKAIDDGEIPAVLAKDKDSWYSKWELESTFNLKAPALRKWVKEGILKARTVSRYGQGVHVQLFLLEDNKDFLPPKKLVESQSVREIKNGKEWHHSEPWYKFVDPHKHLKGYKIMNFLKVTREKEEPQK